MTQIRWDRQADGQWGEKAGRHSAESWGKLHMGSPLMPGLQGTSSTIFRPLACLPNTAQWKKKLLLTKHFCFICTYSVWTELHVRLPKSLYWQISAMKGVGVCSKLAASMMGTYCKTACESMSVHVCVCVSVVNTHCTTWNIKKWRWRCRCATIGWGCVMILSRAMSCGNGCLAHPLITSMFTTIPATITLVFPLSRWPSCLRRFLLSDCRRGGCSRCTARTKQL